MFRMRKVLTETCGGKLLQSLEVHVVAKTLLLQKIIAAHPTNSSNEKKMSCGISSLTSGNFNFGWRLKGGCMTRMPTCSCSSSPAVNAKIDNTCYCRFIAVVAS